MEEIFKKYDPWDDLNSKYNDTKFKRLLDLIEKYQPKNLLEIGCGEGIFTRLLGNYNFKVDAVDISSRAIKRAIKGCKKFNNIKIHLSDIIKFNFIQKYDVILASEVMGYIISFNSILDVGLWLLKVVEYLNFNGKLIIVNTTEIKDVKTGQDEIEYYTWARGSYYSILKSIGMKHTLKRTYSGVKNQTSRKYEIVVFSKNHD